MKQRKINDNENEENENESKRRAYHGDCERGGRLRHIIHKLVQSEEGGLRGLGASRELIDLDLVCLDHGADRLELRGRLAGLEFCRRVEESNVSKCGDARERVMENTDD